MSGGVADNEAPYTPAEMLCVAAAREMRNGEAVLVGMGLPLLACALARLTNAPGMFFVTESGPFDWDPQATNDRGPYQIADPLLTEGSVMVTDMVDALGAFLMGGGADAAMLQAAQIDRFGNLNTLLVGSYENPVRRFPGSGGNVDAGASARRVVSTVPLEKRRFRKRVDFRTTAGYLEGPGGRAAAGLPPQGPNACVTTKCVFRFDTPDGGGAGTCEMVLDGLFEGVAVEEVREVVPWELKIAPDLRRVPPPTDEELDVLRRLDRTFEHLVPGRY